MSNNQKVISVLNRLIETCKNGEKGYREAAESTLNGYYRVLFTEYARQRNSFASVLQGTVRTLGGEPHRKGNAEGTFHRGWMNVRSVMDRDKVRSIALECKRGEMEALQSYEQALEQDLPAEVKSLLEKQYSLIQETAARVEAMLQ